MRESYKRNVRKNLDTTQKLTYIKKTTCDGQEVNVGCGIYDMPADEIAKLVGQ